MIDDKKNIRERYLKLRNQLSDEEVTSYSQKIFSNIYKDKSFENAQCVGTFVGFQKEVQTVLAIQDMLSMKKKVVVPKIMTENREIEFYQIDSIDKLKPGVWGILEPILGKAQYVSAKDIDLMIVPAIAFDQSGYRVGYGGGYYDRYLSKGSLIYTIGVAYDFQLIEKVPREGYDVPVKKIITEKNIYSVIG